MAEIKATSFRINEDDLAKFKEFADKEGYNQAEAFKSILNTVEMATAKNLIKDRAKEVETFQDTINRLMGYYLNSLEVNQNSEERIREELQKELTTKDNTISNLQEQLDKFKIDNNNLKDTSKEISNKNNILQDQLDKSIKENEDKINSLEIANRNNTNLQDQLAEYKEFKNENVTIKKQLEHLQEALTEKSNTISTLINNIKQLEDKTKTDTDMINFYKEQLDANKEEKRDLSKSLVEKEKSHKEEINVLGEKSKIDILELKETHKIAIAEKIEQLNSKHELELGKKDFESTQLRNELEQLKSKTAKKDTKISKTSSDIKE